MNRTRLAAFAVSCVAASPVWAADACSVEVKGNDGMQFDVKMISVDRNCKQFTVNLVHPGKLPKSSMGHNWVLTTQADYRKVATDGTSAGLANDYVRPNDARVIAYTKVIGGGEKTSVTFDTAKLKVGEKYIYFCSFPGHWAMMKGELTLK